MGASASAGIGCGRAQERTARQGRRCGADLRQARGSGATVLSVWTRRRLTASSTQPRPQNAQGDAATITSSVPAGVSGSATEQSHVEVSAQVPQRHWLSETGSPQACAGAGLQWHRWPRRPDTSAPPARQLQHAHAVNSKAHARQNAPHQLVWECRKAVGKQAGETLHLFLGQRAQKSPSRRQRLRSGAARVSTL